LKETGFQGKGRASRRSVPYEEGKNLTRKVRKKKLSKSVHGKGKTVYRGEKKGSDL